MRLTVIILYILLAGVNMPIVSAAPGTDEIGQQIFDQLSTEEINGFISKVSSELGEDIPPLNFQTIKELTQKGLTETWRTLGKMLTGYMFKELMQNLHLMGKLLFLAVLCAMMQNLHSSFEGSGISQLAYSVCFIFIMVIAFTAFNNSLMLARQSVDYMVSFMEALLPLLLSLLAGVGAVTSAALFTPLILFIVTTTSLIVKNIVLPLLIMTAVLEGVNYLTDKYNLTNLAGVLKQASLVVMGLSLVVFIGVITVQGAAGAVADGVTLRAAKYASTTFIPVVGKMFADTVELVMAASLLLKNAIGIFGVVVIGFICIFPLVKLMALVIIMKLTGALVQPMGDERMARCLDGMGNNLLLLFGAVITVVLMYFIVITMIVGTGSLAVMLR